MRITSDGVELVADIDGKIVGHAGRERDPRSFTRRWMTLDDHLTKAGRRAEEIVADLTSPELSKRVALAARWHDVGKALERFRDGTLTRPFQRMLLIAGVPEHGHPRDGALYAKSNRRGGLPAGFLHEVASALAYLQFKQDPDDLVAYLIMCHHGRVRLLSEPRDDEHMDDANGVRPGDRISGAGLERLTDSAEPIECQPARLLASKHWPSWQRRVTRLLLKHGPFELAFLEALLISADWRATP